MNGNIDERQASYSNITSLYHISGKILFHFYAQARIIVVSTQCSAFFFLFIWRTSSFIQFGKPTPGQKRCGLVIPLTYTETKFFYRWYLPFHSYTVNKCQLLDDKSVDLQFFILHRFSIPAFLIIVLIFFFLLSVFILRTLADAAEQAFEFLQHEIDQFVVVRLEIGIRFHFDERVVDDREEYAHQNEIHDADVKEEENRAEKSLRALHVFEREVAQREREHGLDGADEVLVRGQLSPEQQIGQLAKRQEIDQKRDAEHLQVFGRSFDRAAQNAHAAVEFQDLDDFDGSDEDECSEQRYVQFIPQSDGIEVDEIGWNRE